MGRNKSLRALLARSRGVVSVRTSPHLLHIFCRSSTVDSMHTTITLHYPAAVQDQETVRYYTVLAARCACESSESFVQLLASVTLVRLSSTASSALFAVITFVLLSAEGA